jgi:hypothetical protein
MLVFLGLVLATSMSCTLRADELLTQDRYFAKNTDVAENYASTGVLEIQGALLSSPCMLATNEVPLSPDADRVPVILTLTGCGEGAAMTANSAGSVQLVHGALLKGPVEGEWRLSPAHLFMQGAVTLRGGDNQLTYQMSRKEQQVTRKEWDAKDAVLRLRLAYE